MAWVLARGLAWALTWGATEPTEPQVPEAPVAPPAAPAALRWRAPAGCPSASTIVGLVEQPLGRPWVGSELRAEAEVVAEPGGFVLDLRLYRAGTTDRRTIRAASCEALSRATALVVALALDPVTVARRISGEPVGPDPASSSPRPMPDATVPPPERPPPSITAPASSRPPRDAPSSSVPPPERPADPVPPGPAPRADRPGPASPRSAPTAWLGTEGGPELGAVPGVSGMVSLATTVAWPRAQLQLAGLYVLPRTRRVSEADVRVMLGAVAARGCLRLVQRRLQVPLCAGLEAGAMRGDGRRAPEARTAFGPWLAPMASAGVRVPIGERWAIHGRIEAVAALLRPGFEVRDPGDAERVFAPAPVSGRGLVGIDLKIGSW